MSRREPDPGDSRLNGLLREWRDLESPAVLPDGFMDGVWSRIEARQSRAVVPALGGWLGWLAVRLREPLAVMTCLSVFLVAGAALGAWRGREGSDSISEGLRGRYVRLIDPFAAVPR